MHAFWDVEIHDGTAPAFIFDGNIVTYAMLAERVSFWSDELAQAASGHRPLVALEIELHPESIAAYLACLKSGFPVLVAETGSFEPGSRLRDGWSPDILVRTQQGHTTLTGLEHASAPKAMHADLRLLLSTSGSTGDPKLVRLSGDNINSNAVSIAQYLRLTSADRAMSTLPLFYSYGLSVLHSYLHAGASMVLTERSVLDAGFWSLFRETGATSLALVPHQFDLLERTGFDQMNLPTLRYVTQAGGKLAPVSVRRFADMAQAGSWDLVIMYGQTEASPRISYVPPEALGHAHDTIGQPVPGGRMWLRNANGAEITGAGVAGELVYAGPNVMMGYGVVPEDLARGAEHAELSTGDIAERTEDGFFRIVGRLKRFVKLYGMRISLDQIETLLSDHGVEGYACAVDDKLVVLHTSGDDERVRQVIADEYELPENAIGAHPLDEVPLLPSGKTDRGALQKDAVAALAHAQSSAAHDSIGDVIARVTRSKTVDPDDTFASLGGDSLGYLHVEMALEERLGHVPDNWENLPLHELDALSPQAPVRKGFKAVGVDVLLRVGAISMVVAVHSGLHLFFGGPWMLLSLMGFLMVRFQSNLLTQGRIGTFVGKMLYPIVPIYYGLVVLLSFVIATVGSQYLLLYANYYHDDAKNPAELYWYVSAYTQIIAVIALSFAYPPMRRWITRNMWTFGAIGLVLSFAGHAALMLSPLHTPDGMIQWPARHPDSHGLLACLQFFFAGWMIRAAQTQAQVWINVLASVVVMALFSQLKMPVEATAFVGLTLALLIWNPQVQLPTGLATLLQRAATATLFVYLFHVLVVWVLTRVFDDPLPKALAAIPLSFLLAYAIKTTFDYFDAMMADRLRALFARESFSGQHAPEA